MSDQVIIYIALGTAAFLILLMLIGAYITYRMAFYRNPKKEKCDPYFGIGKGKYAPYEDVSRQLIDGIIKLPCEDVYTKSKDGLTLHARYYEKHPGAPIVLLCHGYKSTPLRDFSGAGIMNFDFGYNCIMIDQRAHGESEGRTITFGKKESLDCLCWIEYIRERFGEDRRIILQGMSMGSATVLLAAASNIPKNVAAVMADCPYSSCREILRKVIKDMGLPPAIFYPLLRLGAIIYGRFDPNGVNVSEAAKNIKIPILLVHGGDDDFVPCEMSERIAEAAGCALNKFEGAAHGISYLLDEARYKRLAKEFMENSIKLCEEKNK